MSRSRLCMGKRLHIATASLKSGLLSSFTSKIGRRRAVLKVYSLATLSVTTPEPNSVLLAALQQWTKLALQRHCQLMQTRLRDRSFDEFCIRLVVLGSQNPHTVQVLQLLPRFVPNAATRTRSGGSRCHCAATTEPLCGSSTNSGSGRLLWPTRVTKALADHWTTGPLGGSLSSPNSGSGSLLWQTKA